MRTRKGGESAQPPRLPAGREHGSRFDVDHVRSPLRLSAGVRWFAGGLFRASCESFEPGAEDCEHSGLNYMLIAKMLRVLSKHDVRLRDRP